MALPRSSTTVWLAAGFAAAMSVRPGVGSAQEQPGECALASNPDRRTTPSSDCLACHDGTRASSAANGHRFDIAYDPSRPGLRADPERFNPRVVLSEGRVTCLSCHDPASTLLLHLAAPTGGPVVERLCTACHGFD